MRKKVKYELYFVFLLVFAFILIWPQNLFAVTGEVQKHFSDIKGTMAEKQINYWLEKGLVKIGSSSKFRPNDPVTRAEFFALANRAFGFARTAPVKYTDVKGTDWFAGEIAKAVAIGYIDSYTGKTIKPGNKINRQEVALILSRILSLNSDDRKALNKFNDSDQIGENDRSAVNAVVANGYMRGYSDGSFKPHGAITRAETIVVLDRAVGELYNKAGSFGSDKKTATVNKNVTISTSDVVLRNTIITGNLYLTEGIGDGRVTLNNVIVRGSTKICGGGVHSIVIVNTTLGRVTIDVPDGSNIRLVVSGNSNVGTVITNSDAILEEDGSTGQGFTDIVISTGATIQLSGQFGTVDIKENVDLDLVSGSVSNMIISQTAGGSAVTLGKASVIDILTAEAAATIDGQGRIGTVNVISGNTAITKASIVVGAEGTTIGGLTIIGGKREGDNGGGGNGGGDGNDGNGGNGGGAGDTTPPIVNTYSPADNASAVPLGANLAVTFSENVTATAGKNIIIKKSADNSLFETIGVNSAKVTITGSVVTINPSNDLDYNTGYYVQIDASAFKDSSNNGFTGIADAGTWNFSTIKNTQVTPTFNPVAGAVTFGTSLQIISAGAEHIYYTTDETEPATSVTGSTLEYNDAARPVINTAITVKAIATRAGYLNSATGSAAYTQASTANLTDIALSGSPSNYTFAGGTYTYGGVTVANGVASITVTPTGAGTITVDGTAVTSGIASAAIALTAGTPRTITVVATETGKTARTYTITVTRQIATQATPTFNPAAGAVAFGTSLQIISVEAEHIYYTTNGTEPATSVTGSTLEYNDAARPVIIAAITVKAIATRTGYLNSATGSAAYTQAATANLTDIVLSGSPSNYTFAGGTYTYGGVAVANDVTDITVTPMGAGTITVDGAEVTSGTSSAAIALTIGTPRTIKVVATETGKTAKSYTITVTRQIATQATPTFNPASGAVTFGTSLQIISAEAEHIYYTTDGTEPATSVTGSTLEYNDAARPVINAAITVKAIATRAGYLNSATGSAAYTQAATASITNIVLSGNPINFNYDSHYSAHTSVVLVPNSVESITVMPTGTGTITVDGTEVASGATSAAIALTIGTTRTITVVATGSDNTSKSYSITVMRQLSIGEITGGTGSYKDGDRISFGKTFSSVPVIVVNAYDAAGNPLIAGVRNEAGLAADTTGFTLKLHDKNNSPVTSGATIQWVAVNPAAFGPLVQVQAKYVSSCEYGQFIPFDNVFSSNPIVICSAYDNVSASPIFAAPYNITQNGFDLHQTDTGGDSPNVAISYIAIVPDSKNDNYYADVGILTGKNRYDNNASINYSVIPNMDVILCSAEKDGFAYKVAACNNSQYEFTLKLEDCAGDPGSYVYTYWIVFEFK